MNISLNGKIAFVGGASGGIGYAIASELANSGAQIILASRNEQALINAMKSLSGSGHRYFCVDYSNEHALIQMAGSLKIIRPDIIINNTGGPPSGPIIEANINAFELAFRQHLISAQLFSIAALEGMKEKKWGRIINIISTSVKQPLKGLGVSNTIRAAVANWSKTWANETAAMGITVNNILPGATQTARLESIINHKSKNSGIDIKHLEEEMKREIPAQRFGKPEEIAAAVCFLCSDQASYITGINLPVDGGRTSNL